MNERTLVLIKPDGVVNRHIGEIIARYEREGLDVVGMKMLSMDEHLASIHYAEHINRPYYENLVRFMKSAPIVALVISGDEAILKVRKIHGATNPKEATPNTLRRDFGTSTTVNVVHASDSKESAEKEIHIYFGEMEIFSPPCKVNFSDFG